VFETSKQTGRSHSSEPGGLGGALTDRPARCVRPGQPP